MLWLRVLLALPAGLAVGSFMTVAVHRIPAGESVLRPRSRCPACGTQLRNVDNIPVVSWLLLRGRCHSCGNRISAVYPLLEIATAGLVVTAAIHFDRVWVAAIMGAFLATLPAIALIDLRHKIIPNKLMYPALIGFPVAIAAARLADGGVNLLGAAVGFLAYGGGFFLVALISPRGMGMGDVKLAALVGLVLGSIGLRFVAVAAGAGVLVGGLVSIAALLAGAGRKHAIPFGPSMALGAAVAALAGAPIAHAYLNTLA